MNTSCNCKDILQNYEEEKKDSFFSGRIKKIPDQLLYIQLGAALHSGRCAKHQVTLQKRHNFRQSLSYIARY